LQSVRYKWIYLYSQDLKMGVEPLSFWQNPPHLNPCHAVVVLCVLHLGLWRKVLLFKNGSKAPVDHNGRTLCLLLRLMTVTLPKSLQKIAFWLKLIFFISRGKIGGGQSLVLCSTNHNVFLKKTIVPKSSNTDFLFGLHLLSG